MGIIYLFFCMMDLSSIDRWQSIALRFFFLE